MNRANRQAVMPGNSGYEPYSALLQLDDSCGVSLKGGRGNMIGAASGVILLGLVQDILDLAQVSNYWIEAIDGAVIMFALFPPASPAASPPRRNGSPSRRAGRGTGEPDDRGRRRWRN